MSNRRQNLGRQGEEAAIAYLAKGGYRLLEKNYRCRFGEIDLVVERGQLLIFVEVKTRASHLFGSGAESITLNKQRKIVTTAQFYLISNHIENRPVRFDVIIIKVDANGEMQLDHLEHAFELEC